MHGPGPISPTNPPGWQPTYRQPIRVIDTLVGTLERRARRKYWREIRERAFGMWPVEFAIEEDDPARYSQYQIVADAIRICRGPQEGGDSGGWIESGKGGLMWHGLSAVWWKDYWFKSAAGVVAHEAGHCLGLWHREDHGIMAGGLKPDDHDLETVARYYARRRT